MIPNVGGNVMTRQAILENQPAGELKQRWAKYRKDYPQSSTEDAARILGVSELELVASVCGESSVRLIGNWSELLCDLGALGSVIAHTGNGYAVLEHHGEYGKLRLSRITALVPCNTFGLRFYLNQWRYAFALQEEKQDGIRYSLQFFDRAGEAVHRIYLTDESDQFAYRVLVGAYRAPGQSPPPAVFPCIQSPPKYSDSELVDLIADWRDLKDSQDIHNLLKAAGIIPTRAMDKIGIGFALRLETSLLPFLFESLVDEVLDVTILVGGPGAVQVQTGPLFEIRARADVIEIRNASGRFRLSMDSIASVWIVRVLTVYGELLSAELHDAKGRTIALLYGKRVPEHPEDLAWQRIVVELLELQRCRLPASQTAWATQPGPSVSRTISKPARGTRITS